MHNKKYFCNDVFILITVLESRRNPAKTTLVTSFAGRKLKS